MVCLAAKKTINCTNVMVFVETHCMRLITDAKNTSYRSLLRSLLWYKDKKGKKHVIKNISKIKELRKYESKIII
jgi:hypothetical protein